MEFRKMVMTTAKETVIKNRMFDSVGEFEGGMT